jgi:hypothetical protein
MVITDTVQIVIAADIERDAILVQHQCPVDVPCADPGAANKEINGVARVQLEEAP